MQLRPHSAWTSIDEMCLIDMHRLKDLADADEEPPDSSEPYTFMARYKGAESDATQVRIAGRSPPHTRRSRISHVNRCWPRFVAHLQCPTRLMLTGSAITEVINFQVRKAFYSPGPTMSPIAELLSSRNGSCRGERALTLHSRKRSECLAKIPQTDISMKAFLHDRHL